MNNNLYNFLSPIEKIIDDAKNGKMFILIDDPKRENEGDLILPAQMITAEAINFMAKYGRGLICLALTKNRINELQLPLMNPSNQKNDLTAFTISIEAKEGVTTGISAADRSHTISVAINNKNDKTDIVSPGHVFPLMAWDGGVLERAGHTEAAVDIAKLSGLNPSGVICEIMNDDGSMARLPELIEFAKLHSLRIGTVSDLIKYRLKNSKIIELETERNFESEMGKDFKLKIFKNILSGEKHYALVKNLQKKQIPTYVRMHKLDITKDIFEEKNIFGDEISKSFKIIEKKGSGAIVLINGDMSPNIQKIFNRRDMEDNKLELREYGVGAQILLELGLNKIILLSNSNKKIIALDGFDLEIISQEKI
ncbi:MAG: Riboflavin biosynthesis protein RibBA [Alphaproteobacteria bacterium MarineAlpha5_Bin9]|nr:MAG: Riboflavin biosynthesis protein RibBA [Alphaproteobacteria bacterium MarineAlpha5_Bin9]|tara:strand:+ start:2989 stop:4089 length:1101 start_codon:yes stop_codon:yes gene_type:complete